MIAKTAWTFGMGLGQLSRPLTAYKASRKEEKHARLYKRRTAGTGSWDYDAWNLSATRSLERNLSSLSRESKRNPRVFWGHREASWLHQGHLDRGRDLSLCGGYSGSVFAGSARWTSLEFPIHCDDRYRGASTNLSQKRSTNCLGFLCTKWQLSWKCRNSAAGPRLSWWTLSDHHYLCWRRKAGPAGPRRWAQSLALTAERNQRRRLCHDLQLYLYALDSPLGLWSKWGSNQGKTSRRNDPSVRAGLGKRSRGQGSCRLRLRTRHLSGGRTFLWASSWSPAQDFRVNCR